LSNSGSDSPVHDRRNKSDAELLIFQAQV
jgi:hypothetical protein